VGGDSKKLLAGDTVVLEDESGFSLTPYVARTWSPAGTPATLVHAFGRWEKLSAISAVAVRLRHGRLEAKLYFRLLPRRAVGSRDVADFLRQLARHLDGHVIVVWDNAGQHRGKALRAFLACRPRFEIVPLPPYCPELNPDEGVWSWVKSKDLANLCALDDEDLLRRVRGSLRRMQRRPRLLEGALRGSELPWGELLNPCGGG
jgi:putative transposase